ncbi:MAG: co-chaperone DjlA [Candidatus Comchoanobacterales bacterium]
MSRFTFGILGAILWTTLNLGHPFFGFLLGYIFGASTQMNGPSFQHRYHQAGRHSPEQTIFFHCVFSVMGYIAKKDGNISKKDINTAEFWMRHFKLTPAFRQEAIQAYYLGKSANFNLNETLDRLKFMAPFNPALLDTFIHIQLQTIMTSDGQISTQKRTLIEHLCQYLNRPMPFTSQNGHHQQQHYQTVNTQKAYQVLGLQKNASDAAIKSAYRKLRSQYHPDKLIAQGVPQEMIQAAQEKFQNIKDAYEAICRERKLQ